MSKLGIAGVVELTRARAEKLVASTTDMLILAMFASHKNVHVKKKAEHKMSVLLARNVPLVVLPKKTRGPVRGPDGKFLKKGASITSTV
jgi:hypothetical protein